MPVLFTLAGLLLTVSLQAQSPPADKHKPVGSLYWSGHTGGYAYRWTERDLTATADSSGKPVFSVARAVKQAFGKPDADNGYTFYEVTFWPLSTVGTLLSYERDDWWDGGAHPSGNETFETVDMRNPTRPVKLTDLFDAGQIHRALLADSIVQHVMTRDKIAPPPTLDELVKALAGKEFSGEMDGMYSFPEGLLTDFAFHHIENGKVAVRFLLPHGSEIFRFHHTQLALLLPIPAALKSAFLQAAGKSGMMMQSLQRTTRGRKSTLTLQDRGAPPLK